MASDSATNPANLSSGKDSEQQTLSFVRDCAFSPVIAILTSYDVEVLCEKNQLSFCELLLPFTQLSTETVIKDPNNQNVLIKNLRLDFRDLRKDGFLSNAALPLALGELLRHQSTTAADGMIDGFSGGDGSGYGGDANTPWYDSYRRQFLRLLDPPDHEYNRHYLACILVVSTMHDDPLDQLNRLSQAQHALQHQQQGAAAANVQLPKHAASPKWFSPNTFKYHLVIHDVAAGDDRKAESVYQGMKMNYGAHACHLLRINSAQATNTLGSTPDPWSRFLRHRLRHFNSLRIQEDETTGENNNTNDSENKAADSETLVNGDSVLVGGEQSGTSNNVSTVDGTTIPHPLSCTDLPKLEIQQQPVFSDKEEKLQAIHHGQCLTSSDIDRIKVFVQEFSVRGLFPYIERQLRLLNEQVNARRGFQSTVKSFTTKLWGKAGVSGGSSPNLPAMTTSTSGSTSFGYASSSSSALSSPEKGGGSIPSVPSVTYPYESAEMQTRRLADLAALFQNYELAFGLYNSLKKDFGGAQAWLHSASAAEFATLCIFLAGPTQSRPYRSHYMDEAINTYLTVQGTLLLASRATIYHASILCTSSDYGQAAAQYIRMSSGDDLRSALFLEQAACCFIRAGLRRKAALHLILAGHRYGKANKRQHTVRCYQAALKSYERKGWRFALDHIYLTLGQETPSVDDENSQQISHPPGSKSRGVYSTAPFLPKTVRSTYDAITTNAGVVPTELIFEPSSPASIAITCSLSCLPMIEHDFNAYGLCRITIGLDIQFSEDALELLIKPYAGGMSSPSEFQHFYRGYPLLLWSTTCRRLHLFADPSVLENGFYRQRMELPAMVTLPGIYDISSLKLSCRRKDSQWEELPLLQSQYLTVIQSSRTDYSQLRSNSETSIYYSTS